STDGGLSTAIVSIGVPAVTDNCDNLLTATGTRSDALPLTDPYPLGATLITWTATDASGNAALVVVQTVTVTDAEVPVIAAVSPISVSSDLDACEATPAIIAPIVSDNQGAIAAIGTRDDGLELSATYPLGVTTIT